MQPESNRNIKFITGPINASIMANRNIANFQHKKHDLLLNSQINSSTFHRAMRLSIQLAQCFGLFPVYVGGETYRSIKVKWLHWRMVYCILTFLLVALKTIANTIKEFQTPQTILTLSSTLFHIDGLIKFVIFFKLALQWPSFVREWHHLESKMKNYELCSSLTRNLNAITILIMALGAIEHALINIYNITKRLEKEATAAEGLRVYMMENYSAIFDFVEYALWKGILVEFTSLQMAFIWSFGDVFIMLIGTALKYKLRQITRKVESISRVTDVRVWRTVRRDYLKIVALCDTVNKKLPLIMVCFSINLYFLLSQLFSTLRPIPNIMEKIYFFISFGLMILRFSCDCIFGSGVNDEWKKIRFALQSVHSNAYNIEVQRFIENVETCELVLTGNNFFKITRGLILKISGGIVTYELVLIQFNMDTLKSELN